MAVHAEGGGAAAQVAVYPVGIAHRDGGDAGAGGGMAPSAITDGLSLPELLHLQHLTLQRSHRGQLFSGKGADAVDADSQAHHVVLVLREALDAGRIQDVAHGHVAYSVGYLPGIFLKKLQLAEGEGILLRVLCHAEVGKQAFHLHFRGFLKHLDELREFLFHEAQAVHARVQLDVDGIVRHPLFPQDAGEFPERIDIGNGGFHAGFDDFRVEVRTGGEHQDGQGDTVAAELKPFHRIGHGQVIGPGSLHHGGKLHASVPVRIGLDQNQQLGLRLQQGAEVSVVIRCGLEVELQAGKIILNHGAKLIFWTDKSA